MHCTHKPHYGNVYMYLLINSRHGRRRHSSETKSESEEDNVNIEMMDETVAAMVLTSLSVSPKSPPTQFINRGVYYFTIDCVENKILNNFLSVK